MVLTFNHSIDGRIDAHNNLTYPAEAPAAIGPYSQAIKVGSLVFCSGCIPLDPATMQVVEGGVEKQTEQALKNLKAVVEASGSELGKVVKTTVRISKCVSNSFPDVFLIEKGLLEEYE